MLEFENSGTGEAHDNDDANPFPASQRAFIVSTRPPKKPLSGGMAPAVREASREYEEVIWYALGSEGDKTAMRKAFEKQTPEAKPVPVQRYEVEGFNVRQIQLTKDSWTAHYDEFCNRWIWPVCHNLMQYAKKSISVWDTQGNATVNDLIARDMAFELAQENDKTSPIMIQDYHHFKLAMYLRHYGVENPIIFFNHTPLPTMETMGKMRPKERQEFSDMMKALLQCDSVQFQTEETARRFLKIIGVEKPPAIGPYESIVIPVQEEDKATRFVRVGHAPISINADKVFRVSRDPAPLESKTSIWLEEQMAAPFVLLNFERCDYSKGIKERAEAYIDLMEKRPDLRGKVQLVLQAEPTRPDIPEYRTYAAEVKELVEKINRDKSLWCNGKEPVVFLNANIPNDDLLKIMHRTREVKDPQTGEMVTQKRIICVTAHEDGMNLTAKEGAVANPGVPLIISTGAGASNELACDGKGAIVYTPHEAGNSAPLVKAMIKAFEMPAPEASIRAGNMLEAVKANTIQMWGKFMKDETNIILESRERGAPLPGRQISAYSLEM
jgi:trehalose-6-phosphate synthase